MSLQAQTVFFLENGKIVLKKVQEMTEHLLKRPDKGTIIIPSNSPYGDKIRKKILLALN